MNKIKLEIAEDHESSRKAIVRALKLESSFEVVLSAENGVKLRGQLSALTVALRLTANLYSYDNAAL